MDQAGRGPATDPPPGDGPRYSGRAGSLAAPNDRVSIGQTVTQMPQPMQEEVALSSGSCLRAYCITSMPTWQLRVHSLQAMHLSPATIRKRESPVRVKIHDSICISFASGHQ